MGAFLSLLWDRVFGAEELKVCIIGLDNAGKTTLLYQMHLGEVVATQPTIGSNVELVEHKNVKLQAWDLGGQEQLRTTWKAYFLGANAVILVVDSTDRARIKICKQELHRALEVDVRTGMIIKLEKQFNHWVPSSRSLLKMRMFWYLRISRISRMP